MQLKQILLYSTFIALLPLPAEKQQNLRLTVLKSATEVYSPFRSKMRIGRLESGSFVIKIPSKPQSETASHLILTNVGLVESKSLSAQEYPVTLTEFTSPPIACESDAKLETYSCRGGSEDEGKWQFKLDKLRFFTIISEDCQNQGSKSLKSGSGFSNFKTHMIGPARTDFQFYKTNTTGEVIYAHAWINPNCF